MTTQKDFKRLVRGRMQKTGESYTTARAHLLSAKHDAQGAESSSARRKAQGTKGDGPPVLPLVNGSVQGPVAPADLATIAGLSDAKIREKTGCTWEKWVWALDQVNAHQWPHGEIARYVREKYKVTGWWSQYVTVGYERIRGLREKGQRRSGTWEVSKSRTINAAAGTLFRAFKQPKLRSSWLKDGKAVVRSSVPGKTVRFTWEDGTSVEAYVTPKGRSRAVVSVAHTKLASKAEAARVKAYWEEQLAALAAMVE
ncbi:hypothetical protein PLCT1_01198 [Planctomycetaceae bacterium]|nr:hypothetical protein PLCT1_01198 [Planctomycetaceae bacterium]